MASNTIRIILGIIVFQGVKNLQILYCIEYIKIKLKTQKLTTIYIQVYAHILLCLIVYINAICMFWFLKGHKSDI